MRLSNAEIIEWSIIINRKYTFSSQQDPDENKDASNSEEST
jgi:hypothetical protein